MSLIDSAISLDDLAHVCKEHLQLCVRPIGKSNNTAYVYQCTFCGDQIGTAIPKSTVSPPRIVFDFELIERYNKKRNEIYQTVITPVSDYQYNHPLPYEQFSERFEDFLKSLECIDGVNELMIRNYFNRYLSVQLEKERDLFKTPFFSEGDLQSWLSHELSQWFYIYPEVPGVGYINRDRRNVRLDFVLKAKPELVAKGFTNKGIGIEVKYLNPADRNGFHKRAARGIFQALSYWYSGARWDIEGDSNVEIAAVLIFSNLSFTEDREVLFDSMGEHYRKYWRAYFGLANHGNVGELIFEGTSMDYFRWRMDFSHATYFSGSKKGHLAMGNPNLINKIRIGSTNDKTG